MWVPVILSQGLICASSQDPRKIKFWIRLREGRVIRRRLYGRLRRLLTGPLGPQVPDWLAAAEQAWAGPAPEPGAWRRVAVAVWRDPWMVVGARTFTGDVLARLGLDNVFGACPGRYPRLTAGDIGAAAPDVVLLPDEPYPFTAGDGPEEFRERIRDSGEALPGGGLLRHRPPAGRLRGLERRGARGRQRR